MLALDRTLRPVLRLEVGTVEPGCRGVAGAFRWEAANDEIAMATGAPMNRSRPFLAVVFLVALSLAQAAYGQSGERSEIPDQVRAYALWERGYVLHLSGRYREAVDSFRESIEILPTAEGHTFLGWSLSMLGHLEEAVAECHKAIALDPDYGNPYNDIGVYLIDLGRPVEAIPWLEKAISAKRYCCYQFPHYNLGRVRLVQGNFDAARRSFERALRHDPDYLPARVALEVLDAEIGKPL
jgi:Tfp pilus assembly protein PilF